MNRSANLVFLTAIISGFSIFINKFGVGVNNPFVYTFIKNAMSFILLFSVILLAREARQFKAIKKSDWLRLAAIGFVGGSIPFLLFFWGLQLTSSASASFIHKTMFLFVAVLAYFFLKERFNMRFFAAAGLLMLGNLLFLSLDWQGFNLGDAMVLAATVLWAAENTLSKHVLKDVPPKIVAFSRMFFGSLFILVFLGATGNLQYMLTLSAGQWLWSLLPAFMLALYLLTWYSGLKGVPATFATAVLLLGSPVTTFLNMLFGGASLTLPQAAGMALLAGGIALLLYSFEDFSLKQAFYIGA